MKFILTNQFNRSLTFLRQFWYLRQNLFNNQINVKTDL